VRTKILLLIVTAAVLASYAGPAMSQTSPSGTLDANSLPKATSYDYETVFESVLSPARAQTFTAINSGALTSAQIQISALGEHHECVVRMQIATVDDSGLPTNNILAETTLPYTAFLHDPPTLVGDLVTVTFSDPAQVEAGQKYAFILSLEPPSGDCYYVLPVKTDVYAGGAYAFLRYDEPQWNLATDLDNIFAIYVTPPSVLTSKADCKRGGYEEFGFKNQGRCIKAVNRASK
jgi:hypothetical protein